MVHIGKASCLLLWDEPCIIVTHCWNLLKIPSMPRCRLPKLPFVKVPLVYSIGLTTSLSCCKQGLTLASYHSSIKSSAGSVDYLPGKMCVAC